MKQARREIQRGGCIRFKNLMYKGEYLTGYAEETVVLRYEPREITEIMDILMLRYRLYLNIARSTTNTKRWTTSCQSIHQALAEKEILPQQHLVDLGYTLPSLVVTATGESHGRRGLRWIAEGVWIVLCS